MEELLVAFERRPELLGREVPADGHLEGKLLAVAVDLRDQVALFGHPGVVRDDGNRDVARGQLPVKAVVKGLGEQLRAPDRHSLPDVRLLDRLGSVELNVLRLGDRLAGSAGQSRRRAASPGAGLRPPGFELGSGLSVDLGVRRDWCSRPVGRPGGRPDDPEVVRDEREPLDRLGGRLDVGGQAPVGHRRRDRLERHRQVGRESLG